MTATGFTITHVFTEVSTDVSKLEKFRAMYGHSRSTFIVSKEKYSFTTLCIQVITVTFHCLFQGYLKYSPIFYGYYSNREMTEEGYRLPLAYLLSSLTMYIFSFFVILRKWVAVFYFFWLHKTFWYTFWSEKMPAIAHLISHHECACTCTKASHIFINCVHCEHLDCFEQAW